MFTLKSLIGHPTLLDRQRWVIDLSFNE